MFEFLMGDFTPEELDIFGEVLTALCLSGLVINGALCVENDETGEKHTYHIHIHDSVVCEMDKLEELDAQIGGGDEGNH